ncbi:hypothetical protein ACVWZA_001473 [Sphingomonas sp. UYAg733]
MFETILDPCDVPGSKMAEARVQLTYLWRHRRLAALNAPTLFTELVQQRKLYERDRRLPVLADKIAAKAIAAEMLGAAWVVPTLWAGTILPDTPCWHGQCVIKSRHGCNQTIFVRDGRRDWPAVVARANTWLEKPYGLWLDEWLYRHIPRGILVEPFIGTAGNLPVDYKFYVFGGQTAFVQVHLDREHAHRWIVHDRDWRPIRGGRSEVARPSALNAMIEAAEEMGRGFDFVRVDFYQPADQPLFGEMCFYPGSGLDPFDPPELDAMMGALWLASRDRLNSHRAAAPAGGILPVPVPA